MVNGTKDDDGEQVEPITYEVRGYVDQSAYDDHLFTIIDDGLLTRAEAVGLATDSLNDFCHR
jgi:hypothetical protein